MSILLLRHRYLSALGLSGAVLSGCSASDGSPVSAPLPSATAIDTAAVVPTDSPTASLPTATATATATTTATAAVVPSATASAVSWDPTVLPKPPPTSGPPRLPLPNMPSCPNGKFCVAEADAKGTEMAAAPFAKCATQLSDPKLGASSGRGVNFDVEQTKRERTAKKDACCYDWYIPCPGGRPLVVDGVLRVADEARSNEWLSRTSKQSFEALRAELGELSPADAAFFADHYAREAAYEHASIASFSRVSLSLLSVGAPAELVAETHRAALDEIAHAEAMYLLSSAYRGEAIGPSALDLGGVGAVATTMAAIAEEAFFEGCVGEVAAALVLREEAARADDATTRRMLGTMASDEERHAELAWRTVAWALSADPSAVRGVLERARETVDAELAEPAPRGEASSARITTAHERRALRRRALVEVVVPCLDALLERARLAPVA